jgi:NAD(P)-dependent dehydrogenase (short-subunit alcohol dehydrogenase family)
MASPAYSLTPETAHPPRHSTIVITGGASGIGLATAQYLHYGEYHNNVVVLDRAPNPASVSELKKSSRFMYIPCDVTDWVSQRTAFAKAAIFFGRLGTCNEYKPSLKHRDTARCQLQTTMAYVLNWN